MKRNLGILQTIHERKPEWIHIRDDEGRIPLHYAASIGYLDIVTYLVGKCACCANLRDNYGFFPLHLASIGGHLKVVHRLLEEDCCPFPKEMLDHRGRNILHLAIQSGKFNIVKYVLQSHRKELKKMINGKNVDGNTPLHLASLYCHPRIAQELTWNTEVDITSVNNKNQTALDTCKEFPVENPSYRQRLTWIALKSAGVQYGGPSSFAVKVPLRSNESAWKKKAPNMDKYKDRINTLLLVSTLIITATFAAGFAIPGGINSSDPGKGIALLLNRAWFKLFIFCITISMYGAISVTIILIWAQLGDLSLALLALKVARPLLGVTLATLSLAFLAGVHLVITDLNWLATISLVMGVFFILVLLLLYFLLWLPSSSSISIVRYISYYPFLFLASLVDKDESSGKHKHLDSSDSSQSMETSSHKF
ncbi:hypothetical protein RIF29_38536 [Crotalaria pallida]|uniref:PGG domain-containing protein n=1 Tax=Crotalaria pallida TaxID=3830 RepID=A0AAN9E0C6_CROPI